MSLRPQWEWQLASADGAVVDRPTSPVFATQFDAEQWLGEHWRGLADQGVASAVLLNEGTPAAPVVPLPAT